MAYGSIKVDNIVFTNGGVDQTVTVSGIVQSISGNITATGTIQGATIIGTSTVSGATVTGDAGVFAIITGGTAGFTTVTGTTVTGTTANFATVSGTTVTGTTANFTTISGTTITGGHVTTASGTYTGSVTAASFIPTSSTVPTNGVYLPAANNVALATNGQGRLFVDASGNVGVGTLPSFRLHINEPITTGTNQSLQRITTQSGGSFSIRCSDLSSATPNWEFFTGASEDIVFSPSTTERLRIASTGQIQANGLGSATAPILSFTTDTNTGIYSPGADQLAISTNGTGRLFIDANGNVGVNASSPKGTTTAVANIQLGNSSQIVGRAAGAGLYINNNLYFTGDPLSTFSNPKYIASTLAGGILLSAGQFQFFNAPAGTADADATMTERLRITSDGQLQFKGNGTNGSPGDPAVSFSGSAPAKSLVILSDGKVGLGTSSPSNTAGFSQQLEVAGAIPCLTLNSTSATARSYSVGVNGAGSLLFWDNTASATRMTINSSGYVGIGTSSPGSLLTVQANTTSYGVGGIKIQTAGSNESFLTFGVSSSLGAAYITSSENGTGTNLPIYFNTGSGPTTAMCIDTSQRVGIGTTSPAQVLDIQAGAGITKLTSTTGTNSAYYVATNTGGNAYFGRDNSSGTAFGSSYAAAVWNEANNALVFGTNNTQRAQIDSSGRLLVGTSSNRNGCIQQIEGTTGASAFSLIRNSADTSGPELIIGKTRATSVGGVTTVVSGDSLGSLIWVGADGTDANTIGARIQAVADGGVSGNDLPTRLEFSTTADGAASPTERMRINAAGGFKWSDNATYTSATDAKAEFRQSTNVEGLSVRSTNASLTSTVLLVRSDRNASGGEYNFISAGVAGVDVRFNVANNGNVTNTNSSYLGISDIKLKENIVDANSQWADLKALQVRNYNFKEGQTHTQIGLIAQEVELVSPGLVSESPDRDEEGNDLGTVTKSVNYSVLYMKAVKALQEAMERIEVLEAKVNALEGN